MARLDQYRRGDGKLPSDYAAWQIFGAGFENVGKDGKPVTLPLREPADNEILLRVDALGLCLSDIKIINQGSKHTRLRGRDLAKDPTVLGHECAATVVKVGKNWKDKFGVGERYIVQADIYCNGLGYAFGYLIPGGLAQYAYLDERALDGDEGCYLLPVRPTTGYSQSALSEPWACVEMSYNLDERRSLLAGGRTLVVGEGRLESLPHFSHPVRSVQSVQSVHESETFDDIIIDAPTPEIVNELAPRLNKNAVMWLLGKPSSKGPVSLDIGRIHYEGVRFYGGAPELDAVGRVNARGGLLSGETAIFLGAGGPMGQMHVQRAIEIENGPRLVVVTDLDRARLDHIETRFADLARNKGVQLVTLAPSQFESQAAMDTRIRELSPKGYDDLVILAPVAKLIPGAVALAADHAVVNIFAGLGIGSMADIPLEDLCRGVKLIGSSGSRISDLRKVLSMVEENQLNTDLSIAAIGGLNAAREGLEGVSTARFPGKTVIYTQIPDLPLMALEEVPEKLPELKDKLSPQGAWTKEAEEALLETYL